MIFYSLIITVHYNDHNAIVEEVWLKIRLQPFSCVFVHVIRAYKTRLLAKTPSQNRKLWENWVLSIGGWEKVKPVSRLHHHTDTHYGTWGIHEKGYGYTPTRKPVGLQSQVWGACMRLYMHI